MPFIYVVPSTFTGSDGVSRWEDKETDMGFERINDLSFFHAVVHENWVLRLNKTFFF